MRKRERERLLKSFTKPMPIHKLYWAFEKKFKKNIKTPRKKKDYLKIGRKTIKYYTHQEWRWTGYALSKRIEKWIKETKNSKMVKMVRVDDDVHAGSDLVFITHETGKKYWGSTVVYIPQCTGEKPIRFFLYPSHSKGLEETVKELNKRARKKKDL